MAAVSLARASPTQLSHCARCMRQTLRFSSHPRRQTPATSTPSASTTAAFFLSKFQTLGPQIRTQFLDANQLQLLSLTLNRPSLFPSSPSLTGHAPPPPSGTPLPPGYHLVYFTPAFLEPELGADGTDASYNPAAPFTRRMWAGGEVRWLRGASGRVNPLRVGQVVQETTRVLSAEAKVLRKTGEEMIVVGVEKEFRNEDGVAVVDRRNWLFRKALVATEASSSPPSSNINTAAAVAASRSHSTDSSDEPHSRGAASSTVPPTIAEEKNNVHMHTKTLVQSAVTLFRFSALTFNSHKIHYSASWARDVEGHKDIVVHGPLNLINILNFWRDTRGMASLDPSAWLPESISYRATSPLYAEDEYLIMLEEHGGLARVRIVGPDGAVAMKAEIQEGNP